MTDNAPPPISAKSADRPDGGAGSAQDQTGRICLVTGASRGIGYYAALELARRGAHIIALARTRGGLEELDDDIRAAGGRASLIVGDITDAAAMSRLGETLEERFGHIDGLLANAAILGELSPLGDISEAVWETVMATNLTAQWRLIKTLDPLLRCSDAGRVLCVTSSVARTPRAYWGPYAISKAGLEALAGIYAEEVINTAIKVNILDPGGTRTKMRAQAMPGEPPENVPHPGGVAQLIADMMSPDYSDHSSRISYRDWVQEPAP